MDGPVGTTTACSSANWPNVPATMTMCCDALARHAASPSDLQPLSNNIDCKDVAASRTIYTSICFNQSQARSGAVFCVTLSNHIFLHSVIHIQCNADLPLHSSGFNQTQVLFMAAHSSLTLSSHFCPGLSPLRDPYTMQRGNPSVGTTTAGLLYPGVRPRTHDGTSEKLWCFGDRQCRPLWRGGVKACSTP